MKFLLKYPTRSRPHLFKEIVREFLTLASGKHELTWLVSVDSDDATINSYRAIAKDGDLFGASRVVFCEGQSKNKIEAINRDMDKAPADWEILLDVADDMRPVQKGWDEIVAAYMTTLDCGLWFPDGNRTDLCTLSLFGRPIYERMGCIYHPAFITLWADNYYQYVMEKWGRIKFVKEKTFVHEWKKKNDDDLMKRNEDRALFNADKQTYLRLVRQFDATGKFK